MNTDRFGGIHRLYGISEAARISQAHVAIVGIGGVGTWVVEALARTGIGHITLMDLDDICITNTNRQIHAHDPNYGRGKVAAMSERVLSINPDAQIQCLESFYSERSAEELFDLQPHLIIDAIDSMKAKLHLIASCYQRRIPLITCGGAGGRIDATQLRLADLARSHGDPLLSLLRKKLRREYKLPLEDKCPDIGIPCVFSPEKPRYPQCDGSVSHQKEEGQLGGLGCAQGMGSVTHVTASFGMMMSSAALAYLLREQSQ